MGSGSTKRLEDLKTDSQRQGWRCEPTSDGFWAFAPDGVNKVLWHRQPGDAQYKSGLRQMIRFGYTP